MAGRIDGIALGCLAAGGALVYAALKGKSVPSLITGFVQGKPPAAAAPANQITGTGDSGGTAGSSGGAADIPSGSGQQALQAAASQHGWGSGQQWQALQSLELGEGGFNPRATNPTSGAFGLAQALGHGTAGTAAPDGTNEYGGFGLSDAQARAANSGDPGPQAVWMVNYIAAVYGNPVSAYSAWQSRSPHWY